jgi:predicted secreted protein
MKNLFFASILLLFLQCEQTKTITMANKNDASEKIKIGQQIELSLPSLGGAGYQWLQKSPPTNIISLSDTIIPPNSSAGIGGGGTHIFTITGKTKGIYTLHLQQKRVWENDSIAPINEKILTIEVK